MAGRIETRLKELGLELPDAMAPAGSYVPWQFGDGFLYIAGQGPVRDGTFFYNGKLGADVSVEDGMEAAKLTALNLIAQAKAALGGELDRITRVLKLGGFVNATPDFTEQPKVINGASDLMVDVFGEAGKHARFAVGMPSLPFNMSVEIDAIFEVAS